MDPRTVRAMALDMPGTAEKEHHGRPSFSVKKKIFLTLWADEGRAVLKLVPEQQSLLCAEFPDDLAPVPNNWGRHGWTNAFLEHMPERRLRYFVDLAWRNVAPKWILPTRLPPPKG